MHTVNKPSGEAPRPHFHTMTLSPGPLAPPPKDKYQQLPVKEDYYRIRDELKQARAINEKNDRELIKTKRELRKAYEYIGQLQLVSQLKDFMSGKQTS